MTADEILSARKRLGLTQEQLAGLIGYGAKSRVSEIERGERSPSAAVILLIQAYLDGYRPGNWPEQNGKAHE